MDEVEESLDLEKPIGPPSSLSPQSQSLKALLNNVSSVPEKVLSPLKAQGSFQKSKGNQNKGFLPAISPQRLFGMKTKGNFDSEGKSKSPELNSKEKEHQRNKEEGLPPKIPIQKSIHESQTKAPFQKDQIIKKYQMFFSQNFDELEEDSGESNEIRKKNREKPLEKGKRFLSQSIEQKNKGTVGSFLEQNLEKDPNNQPNCFNEQQLVRSNRTSAKTRGIPKGSKKKQDRVENEKGKELSSEESPMGLKIRQTRHLRCPTASVKNQESHSLAEVVHKKDKEKAKSFINLSEVSREGQNFSKIPLNFSSLKTIGDSKESFDPKRSPDGLGQKERIRFPKHPPPVNTEKKSMFSNLNSIDSPSEKCLSRKPFKPQQNFKIKKPMTPGLRSRIKEAKKANEAQEEEMRRETALECLKSEHEAISSAADVENELEKYKARMRNLQLSPFSYSKLEVKKSKELKIKIRSRNLRKFRPQRVRFRF